MSDTKDNSPLRRAILNGDAEETKRLIADGAKVGAKDDKGWAPLHHAAQIRRVDIALAIVEAGGHMDLDSRTGDGKTPLQIAEERYGSNSAIALFLRGVNQLRAEKMIANLKADLGTP